jgi:hypothetical protein
MWKYLLKREVSHQIRDGRVVIVHIDVDAAIAERRNASASCIILEALETSDNLLLLLCWRRSTTHELRSDNGGSKQGEDVGLETHRDGVKMYVISNGFP